MAALTANMKMLNETKEVQGQTTAAVDRIQRQLGETEEIAGATLEELRQQRNQLDEIDTELDSVHNKLNKSLSLQDQFDRWAGNWLGLKKGKAHKEAQSEIEEAHKKEENDIKEVYEQEKFDPLKQKWKPAGFVLFSNPTIEVADVFDPNNQGADSRWAIEYSMPSVDVEGWTYGKDFATLNKNGTKSDKPGWNSYARRRKWKYTDGHRNQASKEISDRADARARKKLSEKETTPPQKITAADVAEIHGYVPRGGKKPASTETAAGGGGGGGGGGGRKGRAEDELTNEEKAALRDVKDKDAEIDRGLDAIDASLSRLGTMAQAMNQEVHEQSEKINKIEGKIDHVTQKQSVVNARLRYQLK